MEISDLLRASWPYDAPRPQIRQRMKKLSRRALLKTSAVFGGILLLPRLAPGKGRKSANSTLNVALIGGGGIAKTCFNDCENENVIAIADVDDVAGAEGFEPPMCHVRSVAITLAIVSLALITVGRAADSRPNIVLIMTDDHGYGDLGITGNPILETPHLDALARGSATLQNFYVSPVCAPGTTPAAQRAWRVAELDLPILTTNSR